LVPPVPSLFTFRIEVPWVRELAGASVPDVELSIPETKLKSKGPLLFTHWGLSGPAVLRLSAWGARILHAKNYNVSLSVKWSDTRLSDLASHAQSHGAKLVINAPITPISQRIWQALVKLALIPSDRRWSSLSRAEHQKLFEALSNTTLPVTGKSLNKDEFVTCGGVALDEVNFKTMESKVCPGLYFAGELLDIDGITGGFNFQAAWTTGWIAGQSMAASFNANS
jgi:predicted Rossmann fold flavoprotein